MVPETVSEWFPDRPPTWMEVASTALMWIPLVINLSPLDSISWTWGAIGFVSFAVAMGPARNTSFGQRVGEWFGDIGVAGRGTVIIAFAIVVWWTMFTVDIPTVTVNSYVAGAWTTITLYTLAYLVDAGEIDGWSAT
ncbi:hypothetical protein ZOD2009_16773 [Haladaptatus paucihalophilus DX253]|uniref:Uncharacterized protein n=1 Tax=Haladaptatus paucihalophilus DX253 TaxID=797209 RepID=E7QX16_HALPU|nr:hypothetical protein [Haladaptatus paucihalophilus]EFW90819.1 hypothetical protein ZOD2009_16773 [Haladaptatus paucihalophilus DX253]SHK23012.1 hypothetical protein SAMN05444342_1033 [Haladaptatus paucihalophilus DX253]